MADLRIGVIGCGQIASVVHVPLLTKLRGVQVAALADADTVALERCAALAPDASRFPDWRQLITWGKTDAVLISLPTHLHAEAAIAAFSAQLHVYLEKPIASSMGDADAIIAAWKRSGKIGAIGYNYRFNPLFSALRDMVASGSIGQPVTAETFFTTPSSARDTWRESRSSGGGAVLDLATHHIDLLRFIFSAEVSSVSAKIESIETEHDSARLHLEFQSGMTALVTCAFGKPFSDTVSIKGTSGNLSVDLARSLGVARSGRTRTTGPIARLAARLPTPGRVRHLASKLRSPLHEPSFQIAISSFVKAASAGAGFSPDLDDAIAALLVADAAERSASIGMPVAVRTR